MGFFTLNPAFHAELLEELRPHLREVSDQVASICEANIVFPGGRSRPVEVTDTDTGCTVAMMGPFGHIEEWGSVNSNPKAPLRNAVHSVGLDFAEI